MLVIARAIRVAKAKGFGNVHVAKLKNKLTEAPNAALLKGEIRVVEGTLTQLHMIVFDKYDENAPVYTNTVAGASDLFDTMKAQEFFIRVALQALLQLRTNSN
jgi:hypothetical protein